MREFWASGRSPPILEVCGLWAAFDNIADIRRDTQKAQNQTFIYVRNASLSSCIAATSPPATDRFMTKIRFAVKDDAQFLPEIERSSGEAFRQIPHLEWIADDDVQSVERHEDLIRQGLAWV